MFFVAGSKGRLYAPVVFCLVAGHRRKRCVRFYGGHHIPPYPFVGSRRLDLPLRPLFDSRSPVRFCRRCFLDFPFCFISSALFRWCLTPNDGSSDNLCIFKYWHPRGGRAQQWTPLQYPSKSSIDEHECRLA